MWMVLTGAMAWAGGYTLDDIVAASQKGLPVETVRTMAETGGPWNLTHEQAILLLRAGVAPEVIGVMTDGLGPTDEDLAAAREPGPVYELPPPPPPRLNYGLEAGFQEDEDWNPPRSPAGTSPQSRGARMQRTGIGLLSSGIACGVVGLVGYVNTSQTMLERAARGEDWNMTGVYASTALLSAAGPLTISGTVLLAVGGSIDR